jgi:DNA-binding protein HU-beta
MNKSDLIDAIAAEAGVTKGVSRRVVEAFVTTVYKALKEKDKVSIVGFGTFAVIERAARTGVNPANKVPIQIPAKKVAKFKPGAELTKAIK